MKAVSGVARNAVLGTFFKFGTLFIKYMSVPILIGFLGPERYGLWVTLTSFAAIIGVTDLGTGSALQNTLVKHEAEGSGAEAGRAVSSAYAVTALTAAVIIPVCVLLVRLVPVGGFIDTAGVKEAEVSRLLLFLTAAAAVMLVLNLYIRIYNSRQRTAAAMLPELAASVVFMAAIAAASFLQLPETVRLTCTAFLFPLLKAAAAITGTVALFRRYPSLRPGSGGVKFVLMRELVRTGLPFFMIQLCYALIHSTDNIIVSNRLGSAEVTAFSLVYRLMSIGRIFFFMLLAPLWPKISQLYYGNKPQEMLNLLRKYFAIMILVDAAVIAAAFFARPLVGFWSGADIPVSRNLVIFTTIYILLDNITGLYTYGLNGINRAGLQTALFIAGGIINIPLSFYLTGRPGLCSAGAVLASCVCYLPLAVLMPLQLHREIRRMPE